MTPQEMLTSIEKIYSSIDTIGYAEIKPAVKKLLRILYDLVKLQVPPKERKGLKLAKEPKARKGR